MAEIPIEALIREAAQSRGVDPDLALKIAQKESDLYPRAKNKRSSAYGLFQITDPTWKQYGGTDENRYDLMDNIRIGVDIIASNRDRFLREFKRAPNAGELYTMHVFGQTGGPRIMRQDPNTLMADVVSPKVIKANKIPKTQTVGEFIGMLQKKMGSKLDTQMAKRRVKEQTSGTVPMPAAPKETLRETREPVTPVSTNRIPAQRGERLQPLAEAPEGEDRIGVVTKDVLEKLGPNYQAALAAMTLGDTREDDDDDEESLSEQYAARQEDEQRRAEVPRSAALAGLDLSYQSPFGEEQPVMMAKGGIVHRRDGSPIYGEVADSGPVTADTRRALSTRQGLSAAELMRMLKGVAGEGVSNLESIARGSVAAVPGLVGDVESLFRSDKERKFATTPEVERQYLPSRITKPTAQSEGFTEAGTYIDPTIALKVAKPVAQGTAKAALAGFKSVSPQLENIIEKSAFGLDKSYIVKPEGGNWLPSAKRKGEDAADKYIFNLLDDTGIAFNITRNKNKVNDYKDSMDAHTRALARHEQQFSSSPAILESGNVFRRLIARDKELLDEAQVELDNSQSIANFIEKKLKPYIRNNLGTRSDQVRLNMDKWELEQQPKLIAEKQKQIDKVRADIDKAVAARGDINPLMLTNSQAQLRKLMKEMEGIKSRTGSFAQFGSRANMEQLVRDDMEARKLTLMEPVRERFGQLNWPSLPLAGKSTAGKAWESVVDSSMDVYTPNEALEDYSLNFGFSEGAAKSPPAWLTKLVEAEEAGERGKGIYSLPVYSLVDTHFYHMIDELKSSVDPFSNLPKELKRTPKEIEKMSVEDASTLVDKINGWRASNPLGLNLERANSPAVFETKTYPTIPNTDIPNEKQLRWVEIKMPDNMPKEEGRRILNDSLKYEGEVMQHCVGAYCPSVEKGTKVFSLRDIEGRPYATIEAVPDEIDPVADRQYLESVLSPDILRAFDNRDISEKELISMLKDNMAGQEPYMIKQIKGLKNGRPEEEVIPFIDDFVTDPSMNWSAINDIQNTNLRQ